MNDVAFVAMPQASPHHPNMGLSILKAALADFGVDSEIHNFYVDYIEFIGCENYDFVSDDTLYKAMLGEWLFSGCLFDRNMDDDLRYWREVLLIEYPDRFPINKILDLIEIKFKSPEFINWCLNKLDWQQFRIVAFASSFQQHVASLSLAKCISESCPETIIVFGGANCEGEMGEHLLRTYPFVDAVFSGESDETFPAFVVSRLAEKPSGRGAHGKGVRRWPKPIIAEHQVDLNKIPRPDFTDYFDQRKKYPSIVDHYQAVPLFESARGCWWGAKSHCTFCGLNGSSMAYRSKDQSVAFAEIDELAAQFGTDILVVDNILDLKYFQEFLPRLAARNPKLLLHFESKVNLTREQVVNLADAGVRKIQPGIESLSNNVLKVMRKGCTAIQNIAFLKVAAEAGIYVEWGFLCGFPGERPEDYASVAKLIPNLRHLQPPSHISQVRADRFSPYFNDPESFGIAVAPLRAYGHIYPYPTDDLKALAYHFDIFSEDTRDLHTYVKGTVSEVMHWKENRTNFALSMIDHGDVIEVTDARGGEANTEHSFTGLKAAILRFCGDLVPEVDAVRRLDVDNSTFEEALRPLVKNGLVLRDERRLLSLPLRQPGYKRALENHQIREPLSRSFFFADHAGELA